MNKVAVRNSALALLGLAALSVYVLACTSFSPDDSKVLYPTIDPASGLVGIAVYDRTSGKSELLFLPFTQDFERSENGPGCVRSQWLRDGHNLLVAWASPRGHNSDDALSFALLPFNTRGPVRCFQAPNLKDAATMLVEPLPVAGEFLFLVGESNSITRVNLLTGQLRRETGLPEMILLPTPRGDRLAYLAEAEAKEGLMECGFMDPETFVRTPLMEVRSVKFGRDGGFFALSRDGKRLAYCVEETNKWVAHLLEAGREEKVLSLGRSGKLNLANVQFSPKADVLYAAFMDKSASSTNAALGFLEIALATGEVRRNTLIANGGPQDDTASLYFQFDVSNDGKTLAVASTYLNIDHPLAPEDSALFLVDLSDPNRKVKRVPVPVSPEHPLGAPSK